MGARKRTHRLTAALLTLVEACSSPPQPQASPGTAIPTCAVRALIPRLADPEAWRIEVEADAIHESNQCIGPCAPLGPEATWTDPEDERVWTSVHLVGAAANGVLIVETTECGGGTGKFSDVLFVRLETRSLSIEGRRRTIRSLRLLGTLSLGDRRPYRLDLVGNQLRVFRLDEERIERLVVPAP